mgnify:CR=1 FL=1
MKDYIEERVLEVAQYIIYSRATIRKTAKVFGVVSTKPGLLINTALEEKGGIPVALIGRVPVKVLGRVDKGDYILLSQHRPGIGIASKMLPNSDKSRLVGIALKSAHVPRGKVTSVLCTVHSCIA